jgi:F-type H+-transporting ATPase subunit a
MAAEGQAMTAGDYIGHHLKHLQSGKQDSVIDFSVFNFDSIFFSVFLGIVACFFLYKAAKNATSGVPGRFQAAVEMLVEMVDSQAKGIIHNAESRKVVAPLALIVGLWVFLMNSMDFLPVDFLPLIGEKGLGLHALRVVPTADLSTTLGLSVSVLLVCIYYNIKIKGMGGWAHELVSAPFGTSKNPVFALLLGVANFAMQMIEFTAKTVSHGMRLFGNMYAGELVFMLIALMGGSAALSMSGILLPIGQIIAGTIWAIFHILIVALQAFIFMMLTLVYIGQAHDAH